MRFSLRHKILAWVVHTFTASGACIGLFALLMIYEHRILEAFWLMGSAIVVDACDGVLARAVKVKQMIPTIDGALLDNIIDFFNYTLVPAFLLLVVPMVPARGAEITVIFITLASAYQFSQTDAKTDDHFFKGFPSYWNIAVFYLFFCQMQPWVNMLILWLLALLSFIPLKYVYPSRLDYLTHSKILRVAMGVATLIWGIATAGLLWIYPETNLFLVCVSMGYLILYAFISLYRTCIPLKKS